MDEGERIAIRRYDKSQPYFLSNLYLARMRGPVEMEVLADAESIVGERSDVATYVAPSGKMDARRARWELATK